MPRHFSNRQDLYPEANGQFKIHLDYECFNVWHSVILLASDYLLQPRECHELMFLFMDLVDHVEFSSNELLLGSSFI
jgi:hypothetical protein